MHVRVGVCKKGVCKKGMCVFDGQLKAIQLYLTHLDYVCAENCVGGG